MEACDAASCFAPGLIPYPYKSQQTHFDVGGFAK